MCIFFTRGMTFPPKNAACNLCTLTYLLPLCLKYIHVCELHQTSTVKRSPEADAEASRRIRPNRVESQAETRAVL